MNGAIRRLTIVGGGTAGWLAAAMIFAARNRRNDGEDLDITLIESPSIPTVGVGEATTLSMQWTLDLLALDEKDFIRNCDVTLKAGVRFAGWDLHPDGTPAGYYHPFEHPQYLHGYSPAYHFHRRARDGNTPMSFAHAMTASCALFDAMRSPRTVEAGDLEGLIPYAYHVNAGLFAGYLREYCTTVGVRHVLDDVVDVNCDERGFIRSLVLERGGEHDVDFVIDCSGFRSLVLQQALGEPFISFQDSLPCDRAIPLQVAYDDPNSRIPPYTTSTGMTAGWSWNVPLWSRRGTGYVYSSDHVSDDEALAELAALHGVPIPDRPAQPIRMNIGRCRRSWVNNCVGIGLAAGFIEPLESTSIHFVQMAIRWLLDNFPDRDCSPPLRDAFNGLTATLYEEIRDFIVMHYVTSNRDDTPFWRWARNELVRPAALQQNLDLWRYKLPSPADITSRLTLFSEWNYVYVLYGKKWFDGVEFPSEAAVGEADFDIFLQNLARKRDRLMSTAPDHREAIGRIREQAATPWYRSADAPSATATGAASASAIA